MVYLQSRCVCVSILGFCVAFLWAVLCVCFNAVCVCVCGVVLFCLVLVLHARASVCIRRSELLYYFVWNFVSAIELYKYLFIQTHSVVILPPAALYKNINNRHTSLLCQKPPSSTQSRCFLWYNYYDNGI